MVAALLKVAPSTIKAETQFGELPLHLAVEMGATPEVINLLLVNYYPAIHIADNSGRTPMQIILEADAFNMDDHKFTQESLKNAHINLLTIEAQWQAKLDAMAAQHEAHVRQMEMAHQDAIQVEKEHQRNLQKQLARVEGHVQQYKEERRSLDRTLSTHHVEKGTWLEMLETKEETLEDLIKKIENKDQELLRVRSQLHERSDKVLELLDRVEVLEGDLCNITLLHNNSISASMRQAETDIKRMMESQAMLAGTLQGQSRGLALLLRERGIVLPPPPPPPVVTGQVAGQHQDDTAMEEVSAAAAQAATAAIKQAEYEVYEHDVYKEMEEEILQQESTLEHAVSSEEKKDHEDL